jgi:short-subunit dehydrogenase
MYMSPEACVAAALGGIDRRRRFVVPGVFNRVVAFIARRAPLLLLMRINAWLLAPAAGATSAPHRLGRPPLS